MIDTPTHERINESARKYRQAHREKINARRRERRHADHKKENALEHKYWQSHRKEINTQHRKWNLAHPERVKESKHKYKRTHREQVRAKNREWWHTHHEKASEYARVGRHKRKAHIKGNGGSFTAAEWKMLCEKYDYRCLACGEHKPLTVDHVIPISCGGTSFIDNIQPLCGACNSRKKDKIIDYRGRVG